MKTTLTTLTLLVFTLFSVVAQQDAVTQEQKENPNAPEITFESKVIDYGTIPHNANGVREFKFTNTGMEPLIISNCKGSCGCTVPTCPKEKILPGETGTIKVKYATNRVGRFTKTVTVTSNAKSSPERLTIKGNVLPDEADDNSESGE